MAELGDFYAGGGQEIVADVTFDPGGITNGTLVPIELTEPCGQDLVVTVLEEKGQPDQSDNRNVDRRRMHPDAYVGVSVTNDSFYSTEAGDVTVYLEPNFSYNATGNGQKSMTGKMRITGGTWNNDYPQDVRLLCTENQYCIRTASNSTGPVVGGIQIEPFYFQNWGMDDGTLLYASSTVFAETGDGNMSFAQKNNFKDKWNYFPPHNTWMDNISTHEVLFYLVAANNGSTNYIMGHPIELDRANNRCRAIDMTFSTPSGSTIYREPYDTKGTGILSGTNKVWALGKGYMTNETTQATAIDIIAGRASFTTAPTFSADWNDYIGGVLKLIDPSDPTSYRIYQVDGTTDGSDASLIAGYNYNGFTTTTDGNFTTWELWTVNDIASGDVWDTPLDLFTFTAGTWGTYHGSTNYEFNNPVTQPWRGGFWRESTEQAVLANSFMVCGNYGYYSGLFNDTWLNDWKHDFYRLDFSKFRWRGEADDVVHTGLPIKAGEMLTAYWCNNWYSHNGTDWYSNVKDKAYIINNFQHTHSQENVWKERRWVKYEGGFWWVNKSGTNGDNLLDRDLDPDEYIAQYIAEDWYQSPYTDLDEVDTVLGYARMRCFTDFSDFGIYDNPSATLADGAQGANVITGISGPNYRTNELVGLTLTITGTAGGLDDGDYVVEANTNTTITCTGLSFTATETDTISGTFGADTPYWGMHGNWMYCTRINNQSNEDREYQTSMENNYVDDFLTPMSQAGLTIEGNGFWGTPRGMSNTNSGWESSNDFRWTLSKNGDTVYVVLGDFNDLTIDSDSIPYNKTRVIIKGTPL